MDIKRSCALSPFIDNSKAIISPPQNRLPSSFPFESTPDSICALNFSSMMNIHTPERSILLDEQLRLEREIAEQSSIKSQDSFRTTYSSLEILLSQMQVKLASAFLQETEYLKQREQQLEQDEQSLSKHLKQLEDIEVEREQLEKEFAKLKDRLEAAVVHVIKFQTDGEEILRTLFSESRQIDEELSGLISQSLASLGRCRTMINSKINDFTQKSDHIQSELTDRGVFMHNAQLSITLMLQLVNTLNQLNIEHTEDITVAIADFDKHHQQLTDISETTKSHWNIRKEMDEVRLLEHQKIQLEKELLEQTILLENIYTILGKAIIN